MQIYPEILSCNIRKIFQNLLNLSLSVGLKMWAGRAQESSHFCDMLLSGFVYKGEFDAFIHQHNNDDYDPFPEFQLISPSSSCEHIRNILVYFCIRSFNDNNFNCGF